MARRSLYWGIVTLALPGCIVADPPLQEGPARTPPILDLTRARPLITEIIVWESGDGQSGPPPDIHFSIPVRSEDVGDDLRFALHNNYSFQDVTRSQTGPDNRTIPASVLDDTERSIDFDWSPVGETPEGCSQLTLLVSHDSTWEESESRPKVVEGQGDSAVVTWWLNKDPDPEAPNTLRGCPTRAEVQP